MMPILKLNEIGKQATRPARKTPRQRGYSHAWEQYSKDYRREHPICVACRRAPAELVDHITAHEGKDDPLFWDESNHQSLCWSCHSKKTVKQDGGFGNAKEMR